MSVISLSFLYLVLFLCVEALELPSITNYAPQHHAATSFPRLLKLDTAAPLMLLSPSPPPSPPPPPITHHQLPKTYLIILVLSFIALLTICLCSFIWPTNDERVIADPAHDSAASADHTAALHAAALVQDILRPGLENAVVNKLPTLLFTTQHNRLPKEVRKLESYMCAVCISDFEEGETLKLLPACGHAFHKDCIDMWLFSHQTCPLCRLCLLDNKGDVILLEIDEEDDASDTQRGGADGVDDDIVGDSACRLSPLMKMFRRTQSSIDRAAAGLGRRSTKIHLSHSFS